MRNRLLLGSIAAGAIGIAAVSGAMAQDQRLADCGAEVPGNRVLTTFDLAHARDFWLRFPAAGKAPELDVDDPAFVVVFDGPATQPLMAPAPDSSSGVALTSATRDNVVCVVIAGEPNLYSGVDMAGFKP
jgi:hypothetical protein